VVLLLAAALGCGLSGPASAGEVADAAAEAEARLADSPRSEAWDAFARAVDAFWAAAPLGIRTAVLAESVEGYGRYEPRADGPFASGDRLTVYLEPVGYGWIAEDGLSRIGLAVDLEIRGGEGIILASEPGFALIEQAARTRIHELQATIGVTLPTLNPGSYELRLKLRDLSPEGGEATAVFPIEIAG
jgi:hypothetical protein